MPCSWPSLLGLLSAAHGLRAAQVQGLRTGPSLSTAPEMGIGDCPSESDWENRGLAARLGVKQAAQGQMAELPGRLQRAARIADETRPDVKVILIALFGQ